MESWDERYASGRYSAAEPHELLVALREKLKAGRALDLACGAGRHAVFLAEKGWQVTAVDNSRVGIEIACRRAAEKGVEVDFRIADLEKGEFEMRENFYDLICDFYYLQRNLFPKMKAGLRNGGIVIAAVQIYGEDEKPGSFTLCEGELREYFRDFEILHYRETPRADMCGHRRRTAEIVARKI